MIQIQELQARTAAWVKKCFGDKYLYDRQERGLRLLEEAVEVAQAIGLTRTQIAKVVIHVYGRPVGLLSQELAGTGVTLLAMAESCGLQLSAVIENELQRIERKDPEVFRERNRAKAAAGVGNYPTGAACTH